MNIVLGMVLVNKGSSSESGRIEPRKHVAVEAHSLGRDVSRSSRVRGSGVVQNVSQDSRMRGSPSGVKLSSVKLFEKLSGLGTM